MSKLFIKDRFATTPNSLLNNPNISLRAKGLFAFIQGKPDKWRFSAERIALENKEGVQSVRSALQELEEFGFLQRVKTKNKKGHWEIDYILYCEPQNPADENPTLEFRPSETHMTENPTLENHTNNIKKDIIKKDINNKEINTINFDKLLSFLNSKTKRNFKIINEATKKKYLARLKEGYTSKDIANAIENAVNSEYHKENNFTYLTPEFFSRAVTLDKYSSVNNKPKEKSVNKFVIPKGVSFSGPQY